jgi:hypothetical protein
MQPIRKFARILERIADREHYLFSLRDLNAVIPVDYKRLLKIVKSDTDHPAAYSIVTRNYVKPPYITGWTCNDGQYADEEDGTGWHPSRRCVFFHRTVLT